MKKLYLSFLFLSLYSFSSFAQGTVRGVLIDLETQEPLIGGIIRVENNTAGDVSDIDGSYSIQLPAGTYTINHTYTGYQPVQITDIVVTDGEVVSLGNVPLSAGTEIEAVVISVFDHKNTEEGLLNFQRNSTKILDAVSAEAIGRTGDSDVAAVIKRVPGVTIEGGKYVYVRGLGDRYSKSIVNGMEIPGLDPERNTVQMDIFPSNIIDNIVVYKTFSPDLPGDFTGGMVDVVTKDFPLEKEINFSSSFGYNTETTFNNDYLLFDSNFGDAFGFGAKQREVPIPLDYNFNDDPGISEQDQMMSQAFDNTAQPEASNNFMNTNFSFSYGNQFDINENQTLGLIGSISHRSDFSYRPNFVRDDLLLVNGSDGVIDTNNTRLSAGEIGLHEGILNGLLGVSLKSDNSSYSIKAMHTRAGERSAVLRDEEVRDQGFSIPSQRTALGYYQRLISNLVVSGENYFNDRELTWGVSGTMTSVENPDLVQTNIFRPNQNLVFNANSTYSREWRDLEDLHGSVKADYKHPFDFQSRESYIKVGALGNYRQRDFVIYDALVNPVGTSAIPDNNLNNVLSDENLAGPNQSTGFTVVSFVPSRQNQFFANSYLIAGYFIGDLQLTDRLEFIGGVRAENFIMNYDGEVQTPSGRVPFDEETLNELELLPSANFVYEIKDFMNMRASYNRTLARPSFKEKSGARIFDPIQSQFFNGNIELDQTLINNYDLRWEYYFGEKELISISPFFKQFKDPIEIIAFSASNVEPRNQADAEVFGFEFELRKDFAFINENWKDFSFNGNFTFVESQIDLTTPELTKYSSTTVEAPDSRTLLGQSPYSINAGFDYQNSDNGWGANLSYNVKGPTLSIVGVGLTADVYEDPFHNLDLRISRELADKHRISITARNLANDFVEYYYEFDGVEKGTFQSFDIGQTFSVGYSLSLN